MTVTIDVAHDISAELVAGLAVLLPQLSPTAAPLSPADLEAIIAAPGSTLLVASLDGKMVGMLTLVIFSIPSGIRAWIEDVVVDQNVRGRGVGAALTKRAIDEARRRDATSIDLTSRPSRSAANSLYQKLGFEQRVTNVYRFFLESQETEN